MDMVTIITDIPMMSRRHSNIRNKRTRRSRRNNLGITATRTTITVMLTTIMGTPMATTGTRMTIMDTPTTITGTRTLITTMVMRTLTTVTPTTMATPMNTTATPTTMAMHMRTPTDRRSKHKTVKPCPFWECRSLVVA